MRTTRGARARRLTAGAAVALTLPLAGCVAGSTAGEAPAGPSGITAERVLQVTSVHEETGMTLLEGPVFGDDGKLYLVDVTAPAGDPKVMRVDLDAREVEPVFTDSAGAYTSAQLSPYDGRLYLTDYQGGRIVSVSQDGDDPRTFFEGRVKGRAMHPDDLTFDDDGHLFVTDSSPVAYPVGTMSGRVVRIDRDTGRATVLAANLPNPNGISFDLDGGALWVSQLDANRVDHLTLGEGGTAVTAGHAAIHVNGGTDQTDSTAVDAAGNLYQGMHGTPRILVYAPDGTHQTTVTVPAGHEGLESATNVAIRPGTTDAYMTVSGPAGGFVYRFDALAEGIRQSNGG
ncbi:SMP-30/gluconolactonase/LRE family protein [Myceligenerans pegani]|uniref:SMP-30/gluconolactonase/LRE family protein n=1 Tax=Myceligenerans pegani TaxID=2776917 RepID=A0ABR9MXU3_9MICO|nr:SMP-30/gluconolactonase/LRE family protein [Myceligenerans sp. TRM 65318]MBE1876198.1 SMP-30/gluconolactonase/LRE family protein [Myceligenerans sp. TRM 65318]MBE3018469.1 SMP-30/gluconolactonase/LRE family protein [Myceligenerans sp. TRM 65318]